MDEIGLEEALQQGQEAHDRQVMVDGWITTPTCTESMAYHGAHQAELSSGPVRDLLTMIDHEVARQHAAILDLADHFGVPAVSAAEPPDMTPP